MLNKTVFPNDKLTFINGELYKDIFKIQYKSDTE